jgi:hypothetical protein
VRKHTYKEILNYYYPKSLEKIKNRIKEGDNIEFVRLVNWSATTKAKLEAGKHD